jgi:transcriptional regulator with XRE-family HTH domain
MFAQRMRETRDDRHISQAALADKLESEFGITLDPSAITRIEQRRDERGSRAIRLGEAAAIAAALGVPLPDLLRPDSARLAERLAEAKGRAQQIDIAVKHAAHQRELAMREVEELEHQLAAEEAERRAKMRSGYEQMQDEIGEITKEIEYVSSLAAEEMVDPDIPRKHLEVLRERRAHLQDALKELS